nr:immunoglobulin light chain junction region [Macaca mulatta]MOW55834.1 immunoglobulin light chain junction region [Macaca mulatta]MOX23930.1 immunoglobulin light chain junction region [Macaca mulatta]
CQHGYGAPFTF